MIWVSSRKRRLLNTNLIDRQRPSQLIILYRNGSIYENHVLTIDRQITLHTQRTTAESIHPPRQFKMNTSVPDRKEKTPMPAGADYQRHTDDAAGRNDTICEKNMLASWSPVFNLLFESFGWWWQVTDIEVRT